jgi:hypothetical protein
MAGFSHRYGRVEVQYRAIPEGTPVFVVLATDPLACRVISAYFEGLTAEASRRERDGEPPSPEARLLLSGTEAEYTRFADWQEAHPELVKDPD